MARIIRLLTVVLVLVVSVGLIPLFGQNSAPAPATPAAPTAPAGGEAPAPAPVPATDPAPTNPQPTPALAAVDAPAIPIFGRDFFRAAGINFEPNPESPVPADYLLGAGDSLSIICWYGTTEYERTTAEVNAAGEIYLKRLGTVVVAKRTVTQATDELRQRYAKQFTKFELSVRVVGRRTIPVWVLGEVVKPGKFTLSSMSTVFTALHAAGGPTDQGSLRTIRLMRNGKQIGPEIDLYRYLLDGSDVTVALEPGDTLFVPFARTLVTLTGEVRRPAIYELRDADRALGEALTLAGGSTPNSADLVNIVRVTAAQARQTIDCLLPKDAKFPLQGGDIVVVQAVPPPVKNAVAVRGAVYRPGQFSIEKATSIPSLLQLAGGLTPEAYLEQAVIKRQRVDGSTTQLTVNLRQVLAPSAPTPLPLQPGDVLIVYTRAELPELLDIVSIQGEVVKPGTYEFEPGMRIADLVKLAFGPTTKAYLPQAYLYRFPLAATSMLAPVDLEKALAGDARANLTLQSRDRLIVKSRADVLNFVVRVEGEVEQPGALPFHQGMHLSDAVFLAGGVKVNAMLDRALLMRMKRETYTEELIEVSLRDALTKDAQKDLLLQEGDRLVIYPLSQIGEYQFVTVEGAVTAPGTYPYHGEMRVSHLLFLAKSLQLTAYAPRADLYRLRPDNTVEILPVNLTEAMKGALTDANPRLQPRDRLRVVKRDEVGDMPTVKIDGPVRKPGSYPCTTGMKLSDLLHQVGGLLADADPVVQLSREVNGKLTNATFAVTVAGDKLTLAVDPFLQAKDLVNVMYNPGYRDPMAGFVLEGAVSRPGSYPLYREVGKQPKTFYEALSQVTLSSDAYPAGITIFRQQNLIGNARQQSELTRYMRELDQRSGIETMSLPDAPGASETATAQSVQNLSQSLGRVIASESGDALTMVIPPRSMKQQAFGLSLAVDAELVLRTKGRKGDLALAPGDVIIVPTRPETVTVLGGVINNGAIRYQTGKSVTYYLNEAGGVASDGEKATAVVLRMNGQLVPARLVKDVNPGDVIIVPTKYITNTIKTKGPFERAIKTLAEMALIALPFAK